MQTIHDNEKLIKITHPMGIKGILFAYPLQRVPQTKAFKISIILFFIVYIPCLFNSIPFNMLLIELSNDVMSMFPDLLGFNLGGYAIIVGFSNLDLLKSMIKPQSGKNYSLFQETSSIFAFSIIVQSSTLIISYLISNIAKTEIPNPFWLFGYIGELVKLISIIIFPFHLFVSIYAIVLIPFIAINIFSFGQMNHALFNIKSLLERKEDNMAKSTKRRRKKE